MARKDRSRAGKFFKSLATGLEKHEAEKMQSDLAEQATNNGQGSDMFVEINRAEGGWRVELWKRKNQSDGKDNKK